MASVTFSSTVGGDGSTVTDDSDPNTGLGAGGHRTRFVPALAQMVAVAANAASSAASALTSAAAAQAATVCTSTDSRTLSNSASVTFTTQTGLNIVPGMYMRAASNANANTHWMSGFVTGYAGASLTIQMDAKGSGTGSRSDWSISSTATTAGAVQTSRAVNTGGIATGGGDLSADRTITVTKATATEIMAGTDDTHAVTPKALADSALVGTETDATTITPSFAGTFSRKVTLTTNRTLAAPTGCKEGMTYALSLIQGGTGNCTATWNSAYDWGSMGTPVLSTAVGKRDIVFLYCYDASTPKFAASFWKAG